MSQNFGDWDATAGNNTTIGTSSIDIDEGMPPGNVNDAMREIMAAAVRSWGGMHSGTSRPSAVQANRWWLNTTDSSAPVLTWYDGTDNLPFITFDHTANEITLDTANLGNVLDEDDMASDSDTALATQQSIKAYVDANSGGLDNVVEDTTPQLGGDLDVNGNTITSASNGAVTLDPDGTGNIVLGAATVTVEQDIAHSGDANNLVQFGTDTQDFQTGGSSRLDISDSGVRLGGANARVTTVLDEDAMGSDSATALATQQSIKAYVDDNAGSVTVASPVSTSGVASVDISVPAGVNQVDVVLDDVSTNGADLDLRLGDSGGVETTGYKGIAMDAAGNRTSTSLIPLNVSSNDNAVWFGVITMRRVGTSNTWIFGGNTGDTSQVNDSNSVSGTKTLSGELTTVQLRVSTGQLDGGQFTIHTQ